jgi:hypothetical protein
MRRLTAIALVLLLAGAAAACGDDDDAASTGGGGLPSERELETMLLTVDDLPPGWSIDRSSDDEDDEDEDESDDEGQPECLKEAEEDLSHESADVELVHGEDFPALEEELETFDPDEIAEELDRAIAKIDSCDEFDTTASGIALHGRIERVADFPKVGDESATWSMELGAEGIAFEFLVTYFREGPVGGSLTYGELGTADRDLYRTVVEAAADKVADKLAA